MQNKTYKLNFSERLRKLMIQQGHGSRSAASGASPAALCKAIECHPEMALRYLDGRSIPGPDVIVKMAEWLSTTPGFLLFGEQEDKPSDKTINNINIDKDLLIYCLQKVFPLIENAPNRDEALAFSISVLHDISKIEIDSERLKIIFDITIKSSEYFKNGKISQELVHGSARKVSNASS